MVSRDAGPKVEEAPKSRPWEIKAGAYQATTVSHRLPMSIEFIETCLFVPEGQHVGKPLALQSWQKDWIRNGLRQPGGYPAGHPEHAEEECQDCALRRAPARPPVWSAGAQPAQQSAVLRCAEP